jgi:hypothetical protein
LLAVAVALAAASLVEAAVRTDRFERYAVPGQGMSLAVPASWVAVDASLPRAIVERLARENPRLAPFLAQVSGPASPAKFLALDPVVRQGFAANVNVVVTPIPALTFAQYRGALVAEVRSVAGPAIDDTVVTIDGVRGVRLGYRLRIRLGRAFTVQTLQYAFPRRGRSVVVTYTTLPSERSRYAATFARSAASIRFR